MQRRTLLLAAAALGATATGGVRARAAESAGPGGTVDVTIDNFTFAPARLEVAAGARVTWTNRDDVPHTVVGSDAPRLLRSPPLDTGDSFAFAFERPGTVRYFCSLHPHMQGEVIVR